MAAQAAASSASAAGRSNPAASATANTPANQLSNIAKLLGSHVTLTVGDKQTRALSGKLWAYDPTLGVVGLECEASPLPPHLLSAPAAAASVAQASQTSRNRFAQPTNAVGFTIVKVSEIKNIEFSQQTSDSANGAASAAKSQVDALTQIYPVSLKAAQLREADAVRQSLTKIARTGKDVSQLGQQIFDALSKTLPCRWHESHIIVMEEVVISAPGYDPASTNVPGYTQEQLQSFIDGTHKGNVPEGAQSKANSWQRVTKVLQGERRKMNAA
ncbi:AD domain-containing protein [Pseudozyma hubeiensis]|nr:AD domain-containing protein [Pseudozyma hubeiensis]